MDQKPGKSGGGYWGRIMHVDLGTREISIEEPGEAFYRKHLGGIGLAARVMWDRMKPGVDPMGPENILGFVTGLLTDTGSLFTGRFSVVGKSPLTGGWGDANCGGYFSPALKRCGVDAVFFHGASPDPVYFYMDGETAEIRDASDLWGLDSLESEDRLMERHGRRTRVACIGAAGEQRSFMAGICTDRGRLAARGGLGAVMGSKKLKAVAAAGKIRVGTAHKDHIRELSGAFRKRLREHKILKWFMGDRLIGLLGRITRKGSLYMRQPSVLFRVMMSKYGTASMTCLSSEGGDSPVKNWAGVGFRDFPLKKCRKIGAEAVASHEVRKYGCFSCPLRCGGIVRVKDGPYPIEEMHRPEYETLCAFGALLLNDDLHTIFHINDMLNRAGMDTISCGAAIAFAIECFENDILTARDTGGLTLGWGDARSITELTRMIVERRGLGEILADGVRSAARRIGKGSEAFAVHCGGMEPPMHDPKFDPGFGMAYLCEPAPGRHMVSSYALLDLERLDRRFKRAPRPPAFMTPKERFRSDNKGQSMATGSFFRMLVDCVGGCVFGTQIGGDIPVVEWINAATGWDLTDDDCLEIGERVEHLRHAFNIREGLNPARDFSLHPRISGHPPLEKGPARGVSLDTEGMAHSFYREMEWDISSGMPDPERLKRLGLHDVLEDLKIGTDRIKKGR